MRLFSGAASSPIPAMTNFTFAGKSGSARITSSSPLAIYCILALEGRRTDGLARLLNTGSWPTALSVAVDDALRTEGVEDAGYARAERTVTFEALAKDARFTKNQQILLQKISRGEDLEDADYQVLAPVFREHPDLMELLS